MKKSNTGDILISFAVFIQPVLVLLQTVMISVFNMDPEATTVYRVILTAAPMIVAMLVAVKRRSRIFVIGYGISIFILLTHALVFPQNSKYIFEQGTRFFLPVVLPTLLCLMCVRNFELTEKILYKVSWLATLIVFFYIISFFRGKFVFSNYNMVFSYACLLPMVSLYMHRRVWDVVASVILFFSILAIGSRGAAVYFLLFILVDLFRTKSRWRWLLLAIMVAIVCFLPHLVNLFAGMGISSRTVNMYLEGSFADDSGRSGIQQLFWTELKQSPVLGIGVWGDRTVEEIPYCHNLFLEICLDFGLIIGPLVIVWMISELIKIYRKLPKDKKNRLTGYFAALILPLMTSGSYLTSNELALFIGLCYLFKKNNRNIKTIKRKIHNRNVNITTR